MKTTTTNTVSIVNLGPRTASRVVIEQVSEGRWLPHVVLSPLDLGAFSTEGAAAIAVREALAHMAELVDEAYAAPTPSPAALETARSMAASPGAPPMTEADIVALAVKVEGSGATPGAAEARIANPHVVQGTTPPATPAVSTCIDCGAPAVSLRTTNGRMDPVCAKHHAWQ